MIKKKSQQEIAGFALIVVIVMVAGIILLIISSKRDTDEIKSSELDNFLISIMGYTTECAPVSIPNYYNLNKLIIGCYNKERCENIDKEACDYLNETISLIIEDFIKTRNDITAYQMKIMYNSTNRIEQLIPEIAYGSCTKSAVYASQEKIRAGDADLIVSFKVCKGG
jgi:hypothetical protein